MKKRLIQTDIILSLLLLIISSSAAATFPGYSPVFGRVGNGSIPFLENRGQAGDESVAYYARMPGVLVAVTRTGEVRYHFTGRGPDKKPTITIISENFGGASVFNAKGRERSATSVNSLIGSDESKWRRDIPAYQQIEMGQMAPGIDLRLKAHVRNVEKLFFIEPGAKVEAISVEISGADGLSVDSRGQLIVRAGFGQIAFTKPVAFQMIEGKKQPVDASYRLIASGGGFRYGFAVGAYDNAKMLVIDPLLAATLLGGSDTDDEAYGIAVSEYGDVFIAGRTPSVDFPSTGGAVQTTAAGQTDAFIAKFSGDLEILEACTFFGGSGNDSANAIALDSRGMPWIAGETDSADFPTSSTAFDRTHNGGDDAFVATFSSGDLGYLPSSTLLGGASDDRASAIAIGYGDKPYITGTTTSSDFPVTAEAYDTSYNGTSTVGDVFVTGLEWNLSAVRASTFLGGAVQDTPKSLAVTQNDVYVAGYTWSTDFPTTADAHDRTHNGPEGFAYDGFVSRLDDENLQFLRASTFIGGGGRDIVYAIAISGELIYAAGETGSSDFPVTDGAFQTACTDSGDAFVVSFGASALDLKNATRLGGEMDEKAKSILVDDSGNVYVSGETQSSDFPVTAYAYDKTLDSWGYDLFISRLTSALDSLLASTYLGGSSAEYGAGIAQNSRGDIYVVGETWSDNFPVIPGAYKETMTGSVDIFVAKLDAGLSGSATTPVAAIYPDLFNFATVATGGNSIPRTFTITNIGGTDLTIQELTFSAATEEFIITNDLCTDKTVSPSGTCTFSIVFSPATTGEKSTTLTVTSNAATVFAYLLGTGGPLSTDPVLSVSPSSYDFGNTTVGTNAAARVFTIANIGAGSLIPGIISITGADATDFELQNNACAGQSLSAGESCTIAVLFSPDSEGVKNALLTVPSNTDTVSAALTGAGTASSGGGPTEVSGDLYDGNGGPWTLSGSPYIVTGTVNVPQGETLTIEPGVEVRFDGFYGLDVFGSLVADGTAEAKIIFTSNKSTPELGDWKAIYFEAGGGVSLLDHCVVEYGGGDTGWGWANICVDGISSVTVSNTISRRSDDVGLHVKGAADPVVTASEFSHNRYDGMAIQTDSFPQLSNLLAHDNGRWNGVMVEGGNIARSGVWHDAGIPYILTDYGADSGNREILAGVSLTISPGTVVKIRDNGTVSLNVSGTLIAEGTAEKPIVFTSVADDAFSGDTNGDGSASMGAADDWEGIEFNPGTTGSVVRHVIFRYGGQDDYTVGIFTDDIVFTDNTVSFSGSDGIKIEDASPAVERVTVHDSAYDGFWLVNAGPTISGCESKDNGTSGIGLNTGSAPIIENCLLTGNGDAGVSARNGSNVAISGSVISGNANFGVYNGTSDLVLNAKNNWWGDPSGPLDNSDDSGGYYNPNGTGDKVSDDVDYQSWLTSPPGYDGPVLAVAPVSHDFGGIAVGGNSEDFSFTIANTGGGSLVLGTIVLSGDDASEFGIQSDACSGQTLAATGTCRVTVLFSPGTEGSRSADLVIPSGETQQSFPLNGTGVAVPGVLAGDLDANGTLGMEDVVLALQALTGRRPPEINLAADVDEDGRIGLSEAIYLLQRLSLADSVSEEQRLLAIQKAEAGQAILETGDFTAAKDRFAEALAADPGNAAANAGYSLAVVGENAPVFKNVMAGVFASLAASDLSSGYSVLTQMLALFGKLPFYTLSATQGGETPQSLRIPQADDRIDIDLGVPDAMKEIALRIVKGVPLTDTSYFDAVTRIKASLNNYVPQLKTILPLIRRAQEIEDLHVELPSSVFKDMFGYDIDGDGINDVDPPGERVCLDQGDFYLLDALLSVVVGVSDVFSAYSFEGNTFEIKGDVNADGYIGPEEYMPPSPYYRLVSGGAGILAEAGSYLATAVEKLERGLDVTLAETEDYFEILPVNSDSSFRSLLLSLKNSDTYLDVDDLKHLVAGEYTLDLSKGPFYLAGESIRVDAMKFFENPRDLIDCLPEVGSSDGTMTYRADPTLGGICPDGDLADILNRAIGKSTISAIPIIRSLSPTEASLGGTVTISGEGFGASGDSGAIGVGNRAIAATDILSWSDNEIRFKLTTDILSGRLVVTVNGLRSNSLRLDVSGMIVDNFDNVPSAEMVGTPPTTIDSGMFTYDILDMESAVGAPSEWKIAGGFLKEGSDIYRTGGSLDPNLNLARGSNLVLRGRTFSDFTLTVGFGVQEGGLTGTDNDGIGVIFRYQDENNFYRLMSVRDEYWDHGPWTRLEKWVDGHLTVLALTTLPENVYKSVADDGMKTGDINEFRIEAEGGGIRVYLKLQQSGVWSAERLLFDVVDGRFSSGRIGVSSYAMWWALIDYIAIQQ